MRIRNALWSCPVLSVLVMGLPAQEKQAHTGLSEEARSEIRQMIRAEVRAAIQEAMREHAPLTRFDGARIAERVRNRMRDLAVEEDGQEGKGEHGDWQAGPGVRTFSLRGGKGKFVTLGGEGHGQDLQVIVEDDGHEPHGAAGGQKETRVLRARVGSGHEDNGDEDEQEEHEADALQQGHGAHHGVHTFTLKNGAKGKVYSLGGEGHGEGLQVIIEGDEGHAEHGGEGEAAPTTRIIRLRPETGHEQDGDDNDGEGDEHGQHAAGAHHGVHTFTLKSGAKGKVYSLGGDGRGEGQVIVEGDEGHEHGAEGTTATTRVIRLSPESARQQDGDDDEGNGDDEEETESAPAHTVHTLTVPGASAGKTMVLRSGNGGATSVGGATSGGVDEAAPRTVTVKSGVIHL